MANKNVNILLKLQDQFTRPMREAGVITRDQEKSMRKVSQSVIGFSRNVRQGFLGGAAHVLKFGAALSGITGVLSVGALKAFASQSEELAKAQIEAETKLLDECDVVVPVNNIASFLTFSKEYGEECGLIIKSFGHAGDGNLHIYQCSNDLEEAEFKKRVDKYFMKLYDHAVECGGLVSGEHGIGRGKVKYLAESVGATNMALMEGIKKVFDPNMILNPGKVCYTL